MAARGLGKGYTGAKWLTRKKRLALYLRDALCCAYCRVGMEDGAALSLDHLTPHSQGGTNAADNLVTCCLRCNSSRGDRDWRVFAGTVAAYLNHGITADQIIQHVETTRLRPYDTEAAKDLIARRGGFSQTLAILKK